LRGRVREGASTKTSDNNTSPHPNPLPQGRGSLDDFILIDTHGDKVSNQVWQLYEEVIKHSVCIATLIEWDSNIPDLQILIDEADKAQKILNKYEAKNAVA
jgi:uncharacterized protein (UPF0276 family)